MQTRLLKPESEDFVHSPYINERMFPQIKSSLMTPIEPFVRAQKTSVGCHLIKRYTFKYTRETRSWLEKPRQNLENLYIIRYFSVSRWLQRRYINFTKSLHVD